MIDEGLKSGQMVVMFRYLRHSSFGSCALHDWIKPVVTKSLVPMGFWFSITFFFLGFHPWLQNVYSRKDFGFFLIFDLRISFVATKCFVPMGLCCYFHFFYHGLHPWLQNISSRW